MRNKDKMKKKTILTEEEVKHIARLANFVLSEKDIIKFQKQLINILGYIDQLKKVNTMNISPISQVTELKNVFREDIVGPSLPQEKVLANTRDAYKGYFKVKNVFG